MGPSIGLNTTWSIYQVQNYTVNLFGNFSGALLWGRWRFNDVYENNQPRTVAIHVDPVHGTSAMTSALIGLEWISQIQGKEFKIRLGYEAQVWFNQIQYYSYNMGRLNNSLSFQGGVLGFELNF